MNSKEVTDYVSKKKQESQGTIKQIRDGWKNELFQTTVKKRKEDISLIKQVAEKMGISFEEAYNMLHGGDELKKKKFSKKESKETPLKNLEQERKTAAIAELDRLGMKTDKRVEAINAIKFLDDKILIGDTPWAYENMI
jgi:hypothetical protein